MRFLGPFNSGDKTKLFEFTYMVTIALLLSAVVLTPVFITHHLLWTKKYVIQEDVVEAVLIIILLLIAHLLSRVYKKEMRKYRASGSAALRVPKLPPMSPAMTRNLISGTWNTARASCMRPPNALWVVE